MSRIEIIAPALSDDDALRIIREFAEMELRIQARGPLYDDSMEPVLPEATAPDDMNPHDRKAYYESELLRSQLELQTGRIHTMEDTKAPTGWHIIAMSGEGSE